MLGLLSHCCCAVYFSSLLLVQSTDGMESTSSNTPILDSNITTIAPATNTTISDINTNVPATQTTILAATNTTISDINTNVPATQTTIPATQTTIPAANNTPISDINTNVPASQTTIPATQTTIPATTIKISCTQPQGSSITFSLEESMGIFAGLLVIFAAMSLLVVLQGMLIVRNRRRNKNRTSILDGNISKDRLSMDPYATVNMSYMQTLKQPSLITDLEKSPTHPESVLLTKNTAYAKLAKPHPFGLSVSGVYVSSEDIRMRDGSTLCLFPNTKSIEEGGEIGGARKGQVEKEAGIGENEEVGEEKVDDGGGEYCATHNTQIEVDNGIHEHQPDMFPAITGPPKDEGFKDVTQEQMFNSCSSSD